MRPGFGIGIDLDPCRRNRRRAMAPNNELPPLESYDPATRETVKILRGDDWPALLIELEDLAGAIDEAIAPEVVHLVGFDAPVEVRAAAAIALGPTLEECNGEFDDGAAVDLGFLGPPISEATYRQILEVLHRLYLDGTTPKLLRRRALEASIRSPQPWHVGAITAAWSSDDFDWRVTAMFCMGLCWGHDFTQEIEDGFRSEVLEIQGQAIEAAGDRRVMSLMPEILQIMVDESAPRDLRFAAVSAAGGFGGVEVMGALWVVAESDDEELAEYATEVLFDVNAIAALDLDDDLLDFDDDLLDFDDDLLDFEDDLEN
jgi:uncharacterized protein (UPF0147 family)